MVQVRHGSATTTHAVRAAIMRANPPLVRGLAQMIASFARAAEPRAGGQPQDRCEVAQARDGQGYEDRAVGATIHRADRGGRSNGRGIPALYAAAIGRLPLRLAAVDPAPDTICAASLSAAMSHCGAIGSSPMANASLACRTSKVTSRSGRSSHATRSASFAARTFGSHRHRRGTDR